VVFFAAVVGVQLMANETEICAAIWANGAREELYLFIHWRNCCVVWFVLGREENVGADRSWPCLSTVHRHHSSKGLVFITPAAHLSC